MINCLIFSKDRPAQLELLLRSIEDNFKDLNNIQILYKYTSNDFKVGYDLVKAMHKDNSPYPKNRFRFIEEVNFIENTKQIVNLFDQPYCVAFSDDEIIINDYSIIDSLKKFGNYMAQGISIRLHPDITHTYTTNVSCAPTLFKTHLEQVYSWQWRNYKPLDEFGYVGNINSMIYPTNYLKWCINTLPFRSVNNLEECMFNARTYYKPYLMCFEKAKSISIANNITQTEILTNKRSDKIENSLENLNKKFLDGYKISTENLYGIKCNQATTELDYQWVKI